MQLLVEGNLGAIAECDLDLSDIREDDVLLMEAVLSHDRILSQVFAQTELLPLRFGTQFTSEASLRTYLQTHQEPHLHRLAALTNKAEYLVKLTPKPLAVVSPSDTPEEHAHLSHQKQHTPNQALTQQSAEFHQLLAYLQTRNVEVIQSDRHDTEERLYVLSARNPAIAKAQLIDWQRRVPSWQLYGSEPLPPYHFAT